MIEDLDVVALYNIRLNGWLAHTEHSEPFWCTESLTTVFLYFCSYNDIMGSHVSESLKYAFCTDDYTTSDLAMDILDKNILVVPLDVDLKANNDFFPDFSNSVFLI